MKKISYVTFLLFFVLISCSKEDIITINVTDIILNKVSISLTPGKTEYLIATVSPKNATNKNLTWSSDNNSVATVDKNGKVTSINAGTTVVTVTTDDGSLKTSCTIIVTIPVVGLILSKASLTLSVGQTETLVATLIPSNATNQNLTWSSDNSIVAKVDEYGNVSALSIGNTKISATSEDGLKKASCIITISLDNRIVGTKWSTRDIVYEAFNGGTAYDFYEFVSTSDVENYTVKNGITVSSKGSFKYILNYPELSIIKDATTTYVYEFKDSRTIVRKNMNEYAAYMKYIKQ